MAGDFDMLRDKLATRHFRHDQTLDAVKHEMRRADAKFRQLAQKPNGFKTVLQMIRHGLFKEATEFRVKSGYDHGADVWHVWMESRDQTRVVGQQIETKARDGDKKLH
jgi:hypothetical protein